MSQVVFRDALSVLARGDWLNSRVGGVGCSEASVVIMGVWYGGGACFEGRSGR